MVTVFYMSWWYVTYDDGMLRMVTVMFHIVTVCYLWWRCFTCRDCTVHLVTVFTYGDGTFIWWRYVTHGDRNVPYGDGVLLMVTVFYKSWWYCTFGDGNVTYGDGVLSNLYFEKSSRMHQLVLLLKRVPSLCKRALNLNKRALNLHKRVPSLHKTALHLFKTVPSLGKRALNLNNINDYMCRLAVFRQTTRKIMNFIQI